MKAFYCVGTHWDREWYKPFQEFRMWLVELVDEAMDLMESDPEYVCFHLDGQTIVLEDYLEVRPEQRERLLRMLREGRLLVGPWYNLPDEWLISGEGIVRNLLRGLHLCKTWNIPAQDFAYTPDQFGHIAALPMIMHGFGFTAGIVWRGTQDEHFPAQFVWVGPDGSRMPYHKLVDKGSYGPFDFLVRRPLREHGWTDENFERFAKTFLDEETRRAKAPLVLMLDAIDHQRPDPDMPKLFAELRRRYPDIEFEWTSLAAYGKAMAAAMDRLPEHHGELRQPLRAVGREGQYLIVHTISSRYPIKKANDICQAFMEQWVEPWTLFSGMHGGKPIHRYLDLAWDQLLKNQPHDSICGCSVDQVHRDMAYRFDQCLGIGDGVVRRAMAHLAGASSEPGDWGKLAVHNPLPRPRRELTELAIPFPAGYGAGEHRERVYADALWHAERYNKFYLKDAQGNRIPYQLLRIERNVEAQRLSELGREMASPGCDVYHVAADMELPPAGFTGVAVEPTTDATRTFGSMLTGPLSASNGILAIEAEASGLVRITDERTGRTFPNLFHYDDMGDSGDGWTRGIPTNDQVFRGPGDVVSTGIEEDGPLRCVLRIEREFSLPAGIDRFTQGRSRERTPLRVTDYLTLDKGQPFVAVRSVVENSVKDHRLRVLFPTGLDCEESFAETPFAIVRRPIAIPPESATWQERVNSETAFTRFFGLQERQGDGFVVVCPWGLHEYAALDTADRTLALTLLRGFYKTVQQPEEPGGQLLGAHEFLYQIHPIAGAFDAADLVWRAAKAQCRPRAHSVRELRDDASFLALEDGQLVVTAVKPAQDKNGGVIRVWNPTGESRRDALVFSRDITRAYYCALNEEALESPKPEFKGSRMVLEAGPGALSTVRFWTEAIPGEE